MWYFEHLPAAPENRLRGPKNRAERPFLMRHDSKSMRALKRLISVFGENKKVCEI